MILRSVRRRVRGLRGEALAGLTLRVVAVSPYPEVPRAEDGYTPTLLVESTPEPGDGGPTPREVALTALLFGEWALERLGDAALPQRLQALLPRLRVAVELGRVGPAHYATHRAGQRERYYQHREAATYAATLHRDEAGLYLAVESQVGRGAWTDGATLLQAATLAPYEALLRLAAADQAILLDWLEHAVTGWLDGMTAGYPVATWELAPDSDWSPPARE